MTVSSLTSIWSHDDLRCVDEIPLGCRQLGMFSIFQNVNITTCPDQLTVQGLSTSSLPSIHTNTSWVLGCIDANGTVCMPQMNVNTVVSRSSPNVEFIRWMVDTYSVGSWFWWAFLGAIGFKLFVLLLVTRQFYYVPKEDRGTLLCCCGCCQSTKTGKSLSRHGSQLRALVNSDQRRRRMLQLDEDMKNWTSVLRSRDIQLLLRLSRNMPKLSHLVQFSQADADVVDIAKCVLGTGGFIDVALNETLKAILIKERNSDVSLFNANSAMSNSLMSMNSSSFDLSQGTNCSSLDLRRLSSMVGREKKTQDSSDTKEVALYHCDAIDSVTL